MNTIKRAVCFLAITTLLGVTHASAQLLIGVQFQGSSTGTLNSSDTAGLISQDNFNVITSGNLTDASLIDSTGTLSAVTLTLATDDSYTSGSLTSTFGTLTNNNTLLSGKIGSSVNVPAYFTLSGLAPGDYNLIVFTVNNGNPNGVATYNVGNTTYEIFDQYGGNFDGSTFIRGMTGTSATTFDTANYVEFQNVVVDSSGTITMTAQNAPGSYYAADFNGFQLQAVSVPEPSDYALFGLGLLFLIVVHLLRRRTPLSR